MNAANAKPIEERSPHSVWLGVRTRLPASAAMIVLVSHHANALRWQLIDDEAPLPRTGFAALGEIRPLHECSVALTVYPKTRVLSVRRVTSSARWSGQAVDRIRVRVSLWADVEALVRAENGGSFSPRPSIVPQGARTA